MVDESRTTALPRSIDLLWGDRDRPRRGPKPALTLESIVATAIEIADAEGLEALSMQRMAGQLGFTAMSLYRYVPSKDHLIDLMLDTASGHPPDLDGVDGGWMAKIERWVTALWERYQAHPWMLRIPLSNPPIGPYQLAWFESCLHVLADTGLHDDETISMALFLNSATQGLARISADITQAASTGDDAGDNVTYGAVLEKLADTDRYPTLARLAGTGAFASVEDTDSAMVPNLHFGIRRLLDGLQAYVDRQSCRGG